MAQDREIFIPEGDDEVQLGPAKSGSLEKIDTVSRSLPTTTNLPLAKVEEKEKKANVFESKMSSILEKIHDPNFPLAEVNRMIAIEIALVTQDMVTLKQRVEGGEMAESFLQKSYTARIKALQALEKSLTNTDILRNRDILNMEGPKFQYCMGEIIKCFKKACQQALGKGNDTTIESIMKDWRDEMGIREADLRREIENIDSAK